MINELDYIENINENVLNYEIDMSTFDQKEFDDVKIYKYCNHNFEKAYNGRKITLTEKVNKYKLKRIIDDFENNNINEETQNNLKQYYNSLNKEGEINIIYKQNNNTGRYYSNKFSLQNMSNKARSSIIHKNCIDVYFKNSIVTIIAYLAEKHNLKIPNIVSFSSKITRKFSFNNITFFRISIKPKNQFTILNNSVFFLYTIIFTNIKFFI